MIEIICAVTAIVAMETAVCTPPPLSDIDYALLTIYDPTVCPPGQPCVQGNGDGRFADMTVVDRSQYSAVAACPDAMLGQMVHIPAAGLALRCRDTFGYWNGQRVETVVFIRGVGWAIRVDVFYPLEPLPWWNVNTLAVGP